MLAVALAALSLATVPTEGVGFGTHGRAVHDANGVSFTLRGLPAGADARAVLQAGTCTHPSASFASVGSGHVAANGRAAWTSRIRFHGRPVAWSTVADGKHVLRILAGGRVVACGAIDGMS